MLSALTNEGPDVPPVRNWSSIIKRLVLGLLVGAVVTVLPWLVSKLNDEELWPINILLIPGVIVAVIADGGNVHTYSPTLLNAANTVLYAMFTYKLLSLREKRKSSNQSHPDSSA